MHNHFNQYLNLKHWIDVSEPKLIVECGAGTGELTKLIGDNISSDCSFHVISDKKIQGLDQKVFWKSGLSYNVLKEYPDNSIDFCIIDTDHNFWTLTQELESVKDKIAEGGLIALHDVQTFYHSTGMALSYGTDTPYPKGEIEKFAHFGGLGDAMIEFLMKNKTKYQLFYFTPESHGAALLLKNTQTEYVVYLPGSQPSY